jgi:hypothetical protein
MRRLLHMVSTLLCALMAAGAASSMAAPGAARSNHLKGSSSPYLQRASQELVDWYPWGESIQKSQSSRPANSSRLGSGVVSILFADGSRELQPAGTRKIY